MLEGFRGCGGFHLGMSSSKEGTIHCHLHVYLSELGVQSRGDKFRPYPLIT